MNPDEFHGLVRKFLPDGPGNFIELGGAPGRVSAYLLVDTELRGFAVDFSENSRAYLEAMEAIGKQGTLYETDVFAFEPPHQFDVVSSFGLVEHFAGKDLDRLLRIHDELAKPGGLVVIEMPNFRGVQRMWHTLVDRPNLRLHNLDAMRLDTFDCFEGRGYATVHKGYFGHFRVWQETRFLQSDRARKLVTFASRVVNKASREAKRVGIRLEGSWWSPYIVYIGRKPGAMAESPPDGGLVT